MSRVFVASLVVLCSVNECRPTQDAREAPPTSAPSAPVTVQSADMLPVVDEGPVRTEDVAVPGDRPAVVVRGSPTHAHPIVFVPGMCVHPGGYVMSFQHAAAAHGDLVSVQGDVSCGGDGAARMWSSDLESMNRRIDAAFAAGGLAPPRDVLVIGYSQGAERAEKLVARWPEKYSRAILIASPVAPSKALLAKARAVVTMAGTLDVSRPRMRDAADMLRRAHVRAAFFELPGARHGQMGETPEESMREAIEFAFDETM